MAIVESKLKTGSLKLGSTEFACQATNVRIVPSFNEEGDTVETLCGDSLAPSTTTDWALQGTHIQDWDSGGLGIVEYSWVNNLVTVPFIWKPNASDVSFAGNVQVRALELGGDVNTRITTDFDWPITGTPTPTWSTGATATVASVSPNTAAVTETAVPITVTGTGFVSTAVIRFGGIQLTTQFVSATQMTATADPSTQAVGPVDVDVMSPDMTISAPVVFTITATRAADEGTQQADEDEGSQPYEAPEENNTTEEDDTTEETDKRGRGRRGH